MGDDKRLHRQDPERTGPIRSFTQMYAGGPAVRLHDETANSAISENAAELQGQGIDLAYQVIDKHINDGRRTAAMLNGRPYNTRAATDRLQEVIERTIRYSSELLPLWLEALTTAVRIEPPRMQPVPSPKASTEEGQARPERSVAVGVEILATRPVSVSVDLRENSERMPLAALGLRAVDRSKPELSDIGIEPDPAGGIKLRISIPRSFPSGTYSGVIVNSDTGESRGTLTVRVSDS
jgi:hypothetical protein